MAALFVGAFLAVLGIIMAAAFALDRRERKRIALDLATIARVLDGRAEERAVYATIDGARCELRHVTRGSGKSAQSWTELDVELPAKYPLAMLVRRHGWRDGAKIARGDMTDLALGDREFDEAFLVEAAPEDIVKLLLDVPVRRLLLYSFENADLATVSEGGKKLLRFSVRGWIHDRQRTADLVRTIGSIGARTREAYATADAAVPLEREGGPFRETVNDEPRQRAQAARAGEVAYVELAQARRTHEQRVGQLGIAIVLVAAAALVLAIAR